MDGLSKDLIALLQYLLPGFITAWIYYGLTPYSRPSQFERTVQALIFTVLLQVISQVIQSICLFLGNYFSIGNWTAETSLWVSIISALILGLLIAYLTNNDKIHYFLRKFKFTKETSHSSEWYTTFTENPMYVVLHLKDERRIRGYPIDWPSDPTKGHFRLSNISWLSGKRAVDFPTMKYILIDMVDVKWVEFIKSQEEVENERRSNKTTRNSRKRNKR